MTKLSIASAINAQLMQYRFDFKAIALRQDKQSHKGCVPKQRKTSKTFYYD